MIRNITFDCPSCGAPVTTPENMLSVQCVYCGNNLTVPAALRPPPPPQMPYAPPTNIYINTSQSGGPVMGTGIPGQFYINPAQQQASRRISRGVSCFIIGMILFVVLVTVVPILITSWTIFDVFKHIPSVPGR